MALTAPERAIGDATTATLLALLRVYERDGRATVRAVAAERGCSLNSAHKQLVELRDLGLADWDDGRAGTLRPLVAVVSVLE